MDIRKIKNFANIGMNLSGVTFLICSLYISLIKDYINTELMFGILALMAASTGLLNSWIYRMTKKHLEAKDPEK